MANGLFNIARGSYKYYYYMVKNALTLASAGQFTVATGMSLAVVGLKTVQADATLADHDDLAALLAAGGGTANVEPTNTGYIRKFLVAADLAAVPAPDDTNERLDLDLPDITWTSVAAAGGAWVKLLVCFKPATASADSAIVPISYHDFAVTPDGNNILATIAAAGSYRSA
jgi:hypothetical protein